MSQKKPFNMAPLLDKERMFFEFTQAVMNKGDLSKLKFQILLQANKDSLSLIREKFVGSSYSKIHKIGFQNSKLEYLVVSLAHWLKNDIFEPNYIHNHFKNAMIHIHQTILFHLESLTSNEECQSKLKEMKGNFKQARSSLQKMLERLDRPETKGLIRILERVQNKFYTLDLLEIDLRRAL